MRFKPDMSESGNEPVADGIYNLTIYGEPKIKLSKGDKTKGLPYLTFQLNHNGSSGPPIFERVFIVGKQAWRFSNLMKQLGLTKNDISEMEVVTADGSDPSTEQDAPASLIVQGQPFSVAGKPVTALLSTEQDEEFGPKNRIKKYVAS